MRQGRASRDVKESRAVTAPSANGINPGYVSQLGNKVGNHITDDKNTGYTGERMYKGRGFEAPRNKSQSSTNSGSQGRY